MFVSRNIVLWFKSLPDDLGRIRTDLEGIFGGKIVPKKKQSGRVSFFLFRFVCLSYRHRCLVLKLSMSAVATLASALLSFKIIYRSNLSISTRSMTSFLHVVLCPGCHDVEKSLDFASQTVHKVGPLGTSLVMVYGEGRSVQRIDNIT